MTRRGFLKLLFLLLVLLLIEPLRVSKTLHPRRGNLYDFTPRPKGRVLKFLPPAGEVVRHRGNRKRLDETPLHRLDRV